MNERRPRAALLTQELPWPLDNGLKLRSFQFLEALGEEFDTTLIAFSESDRIQEAVRDLQVRLPSLSRCIVHRHTIRLRRRPIQLLRIVLSSIVLQQPYTIGKFRSAQMVRSLETELANESFDWVVTTLPMFPYAQSLSGYDRWILECQNIEHQLWRSLASSVQPGMRWWVRRESRLLQALEERLWKRVACTTTVCNEDADEIKRLSGVDCVHVVRSTLPGPQASSATSRWNGGVVGLLGSWSWKPSRDALAWFIENVMPLLRSANHPPRVLLAGSGLSGSLLRIAKKAGLEVVGYVENIDQFYRQVDIVAGTYFTGGGVRVKILEAMLKNKLVIGTPLAFRGLPLIPGVSGIVCESADDFAKSILEYASNEATSIAIAARGCELASSTHDRMKIQSSLCRIIGELR